MDTTPVPLTGWVHDHQPEVLDPATFDHQVVELSQQIHNRLLAPLADTLAKHGISYYLHGGSLLGAVREGGWIAWDDDVDVLIPRAEYRRLVEIDPQWPDQIQLLSTGPFAVMGRLAYIPSSYELIRPVGIDLFPADPVPSNPLLRNWHRKAVNGAEILARARLHADVNEDWTTGRRRRTWRWLRKAPITAELRYQLLEWLWRLPDERSEYWRAAGQPNYVPDVFQSEWFAPAKLTAFEDLRLPAPANSAEVLEVLYGPDYLTPPPESARTPHTFFLTFCAELDGKQICLQRSHR